MQMSYNNYLDADAAFSTVCDFPEPTCVVVKHTNPCGVASRPDLREAYRLAVQADPISAFGGIVAFNRHAFCAVVLPLRMSPPPVSEALPVSAQTPAQKHFATTICKTASC